MKFASRSRSRASRSRSCPPSNAHISHEPNQQTTRRRHLPTPGKCGHPPPVTHVQVNLSLHLSVRHKLELTAHYRRVKMSIAPIFQDLVARDLPLESIFLDPNNPRFVGPNWQRIEDDQIDSESVQEKARRLLIAEYGVDKLRMNMEVNGYLPIDRVIVRKFKDSKFVVLEGNRRICAAMMLTAIGTDGMQVADEVLSSAKSIPCLEYVGTETDAAWIFQGLRHITGISEWSAYNKAKLLVEQMEQEGLNLTEAGKRFGLTAFGAGQWVRGYYAFKQAREESDYIREVDERAYPYFQELFSRSSAPVREWMGWEE